MPFKLILFTFALLVVAGCGSTPHGTHEEAQILPQYVFSPAENPKALVEQSLLKAEQQGKLALIVMGAQWCHDSRALAANFSKPEMQDVLAERFVTQFVDVGFYQDLRGITQLVDYPTYFATPTVLVVEPMSRRVINRGSIDIWQSAASVSYSDYVDYFASVTDKGMADPIRSPQLNEFMQTQIARLQRGYDHLGPILEKDVNGEAVDGEALNILWREVRDFRLTLQKDIHRLQQSKATKVADVEWPEYGAKSWE